LITALVCCSDTRRRNKITSLLQSMGITVVAEAADSPQALRMARSSKPGLVVIDIEQYDYNEMETATIIAKERLAPVILVTLPQQQNIINTINENPTISYVIKPVNHWALESAVYTSLASFRKMVQMESEINKLKDTLETRKLVERAKHILMRDLQLSEPEAFRRMQKQSMDKGTAMRELAEAILLNDDLKKSW